MKFGGILGFELAYQLRRVWLWLILAALVVLSFMLTRDAMLAEALLEEFFVNSPFAIAKTTVVGGMIWLVAAAAVAGEAAARDVATGMHPLVYTSSVSRNAYLGGRFLAALIVNAVLLLGVQVGILLAVYAPGVDPVLIGPFRPAGHLTAYGFLALPNAFAATAIQFALAARSGRPMAGYLGSLLLIFMTFFLGTLLLVMQGPGRLLDFVGVHFILSDLSYLWTPTEKNVRLLALEGTVLLNRVLWLGMGVAALAATWLSFRFEHRSEVAWWSRFARRRVAEPNAMRGVVVGEPETGGPSIVAADPPISRGIGVRARQTFAIAWTSFRALAASWAGIAMLAGIPLVTILVVLDQMAWGVTPLIPTTALVVPELTGPLTAELSRWVIVPLLLIFFAGELVWRERDAGMGEIADAMPGSEWTPLLGKLLGLALLVVAFSLPLMLAGMAGQTILGHTEFEVGLYLKTLFGLQLVEYLLFIPLALAIHVVVDQKYIGHLVAIVAYIVIALAPMFGIEHDLSIYGAGPVWSYTEMRGFGASLAPWLWFKLYWAAWALLLAVLARLLWARGREGSARARLGLARGRLTRPTALAAAAGAALVLVLGGFVFYNTNVLNEYVSSDDVAERQAEYERRYARYAGIAQPRLAAVDLHVEIHPDRRTLDVRGSYRLENRSAAAIDSIHVATQAGVETGDIAFDRPAERVLADDDLGHRIYVLDDPLEPGDSVRLDFTVRVEPRGFRESGALSPVVANGTFFTNALLPAIGYQPTRELITAADRRGHGLPERPVIPSLYDADSRTERGGRITFEATVGTSADQVAVAPGDLQRTWTENGRRYFHYSAEGPVWGDWAFLSADYAVREARWEGQGSSGGDVAIRIFHHPDHTGNVERMVRGIQASLDVYTAQFGPHPFGHISFVERPGNGTGMHADPGMVTFSEGAALARPGNDPRRLDLPFSVVTHEMGHQWTVPYAYVEGAPIMSESLAWYYGMQVVEAERGRDQLHALLRFMRQPYPYPTIRRGQPLLRGLDPYMAYRKGPFALHALREYVGRDQVNAALRRIVEVHRRDDARPATTLDLYRELQAVTPDSLGYLLHDLFEVNAFWELGTDEVTARQTPNGEWQVTLDVRARKVVTDSAGMETEVPLDVWIDVGVFGEPSPGSAELSAPLYVRKHRVRSGRQTITVTVPDRPVLAGIDPYHVLDWEEREDDDNIERVSIDGGGAGQ